MNDIELVFLHNGQVSGDFALSLASAVGCGAISSYRSGPQIALHRNRAVTEFLATDLQFLLFVDSDMVFTRSDIAALRAHDLPVVSGYTYRVAVLSDGVELFPIAPPNPTPGLNKARIVGMAFTLIRRDVLEKMAAEHPEPFVWFRADSDADNVGEDGYFSKRVREMGTDIYIDTDVRIGHQKLVTFRPPVL